MLSEALETLFAKEQEATRLAKLPIDHPAKQFYDQRGNVLAVDLPIPARRHSVETIDSLAHAVDKYGRTVSSCWASLSRVVAILNDGSDEHRCCTVTLPVAPAPYFGVLEKCGGDSGWMPQKALIDVLRHDLAGTTIDPANTLAVLRNLRFATQSEQTGAYTADSAKMGKSVASQVTGESALPEVVSVEFHPYPAIADEVDVSVLVFCTLFANPENGRLKLDPQPGQIQAAKTKATIALAKAVKDAVGDVPVFVGSP